MNVVEKVNQILKQANISKVNLAKYLGVSRQMIYNYFDGDDLSKLPNDKYQLLYDLLCKRNLRVPFVVIYIHTWDPYMR